MINATSAGRPVKPGLPTRHAPTQFHNEVWSYLGDHIQWIECGGPMRSPDLTSMDFFAARALLTLLVPACMGGLC